MEDIELARHAAVAGARVVRRWAGHGAPLSYKATDNPVTAADHEAEEAIVALLREHRPDDDILSEEGGGAALEERPPAERRWVVDPLDGTVNFIQGIPHVGVSVALCVGTEPVAGAVVDVFRDEIFTAATGRGAAHDGVPIRVSGRPGLEGAVVATGFPYDHAIRDYTPPLRAVLGRVQGVRRFGAAALDFAWVAAGRYDGFWELGLAPWDTAAGMVLVREAGGRVTDPHGEHATLDTHLVVASNGHVHDDLAALIAAELPAHLR